MRLSNIGVHNQEGSMFEDLSLDLHLHILSFTDPGDIIALRKTCKLFHYISSQRIIWVDHLRRVCADNSVFKPTFPIDEMSVIDLEGAVFAPTRWLNQVMNNNYDDISSSRRVRTITPSKNPRFRGLYLVPGGRFLITFSEVDMCVWDLGYTSSTILKNTPIAVAPHIFNEIFSVVPTADELGLRIFASTSETGGWADEECICGEFRIFEIYPLSKKPTLSRIASVVEEFSEATLFSLRGDLLVHQHATYVKIWNFVTDMGETLNVGDGPFKQLCVTADSIVLIRAAAMLSIWSIPPLIPGGHMGEPGVQLVKPNIELFVDCKTDIDFPEEGEELRERLERPSQWYTHHPITYDVIYQYEESCTVSRYEVVLPEGHIQLQNKLILPMEWVTTFLEPPRICNGNLVMYWSSYRSVKAAAVPRERQIIEDFWESEGLTLLCSQTQLDHLKFTLCPVAGRLCRISPEHDYIVVFDYLTPPSS